MKKHFFALLLIIFCNYTFSQVTEKETNLRTINKDTTIGWESGGVINIGLSQTALKHWSAGGENSLAINGLLSLFANYKKQNSSFDNTLDIGYGVLNQGKNGDFVKTDDKIDLLSKYGLRASKNWHYALLFNAKTQMTPGYNYPNDSIKISNFIAPAYFILAIGLDHKPNDNLSLFIAPATARLTLVNDQLLADQGAFGVDKAEFDATGQMITRGKKTLSEFGGYLRMQYKKEIIQNIVFQTKVDLFSNYLKAPQNVVINWETIISLKVNKFISATIATTLVYDDKVKIGIDDNNDGTIDRKAPRTQFKEVLSVGFSYKF